MLQQTSVLCHLHHLCIAEKFGAEPCISYIIILLMLRYAMLINISLDIIK